ncbi:hypothetical protein G7085_08285 [Tessaracoccus sp. HDW20]|uniref:SPFH domain-containing protein n=1 Tax=Tessaracoccus coleopterorum TaxID=2714950 RepID=UPI0018D4AC3B|nr:SPFH domain-containing protein [Tessaracoccus coleopterorum]NHB84608.1 hypothetical protein [Tessaracoccus coleopterorum]
MAKITRFPFVRHLRGTATTYTECLTKGRRTQAGVGAGFWFRPLTAAISEVPVDDREQEALVRIRTSDLQEVTAPATVTYRFAEPSQAAARVDFSIDPTNGRWLESPLETVGAMIHGATGAAVTGTLSGRPLREVLSLDVAGIADGAIARLRADERLTAIGVEVIGVRFSLLRPEPEVERALQLPAREQVQQEADRATFERRALAVEKEAAIGENELANQIELARRQEQLIAQNGANARREAEDAAVADAVRVRAEASRAATLSQTKADATRVLGEAEADAEAARLDAYREASRDVLLALALRELAANLPKVESLVLTPDLITGMLGRLTAGGRD